MTELKGKLCSTGGAEMCRAVILIHFETNILIHAQAIQAYIREHEKHLARPMQQSSSNQIDVLHSLCNRLRLGCLRHSGNHTQHSFITISWGSFSRLSRSRYCDFSKCRLRPVSATFDCLSLANTFLSLLGVRCMGFVCFNTFTISISLMSVRGQAIMALN